MCMSGSAFGIHGDGQSSVFEAIEVLLYICVYLHSRNASLVKSLAAHYLCIPSTQPKIDLQRKKLLARNLYCVLPDTGGHQDKG
jgi:hypothetical protein